MANSLNLRTYIPLEDIDADGRDSGLFACEGDCDRDTDCFGDLKCYQRNNGSPIPPGCTGTPSGIWDYCYNPSTYPWIWHVECGDDNDCDNLLECQGDCDEDADCVGNLKCFQRNVGHSVPPGCYTDPNSNLEYGEYDYCYDASKYQWLWIWNVDVDGSNLLECEGDCDTDDDCVGNLKCYQRGHFLDGPNPPGCKGMPNNNWDYCYDPNSDLWSWVVNQYNVMNECEGNCEEDANCAGNLKCFHRTKGGPNPPGCAGLIDWYEYDSRNYCYDPSKGLLSLWDVGEDPDHKLYECQGDCDEDINCAGTLKCYQRNLDDADGAIPPGCTGTPTREWDYCYDPSNASYSVPLFGYYFHSLTVVVVAILMVLVGSVLMNIYCGYRWKNRVYTAVSKQDIDIVSEIVSETDL